MEFFRPTITKALSGRPPREKLSSSQQTWCTACARQSLQGVAVKVSNISGQSCSSHTCIPSSSNFIPKSVQLRPWPEVFLIKKKRKTKLWNHFILTQYFSIPSLNSYPPTYPSTYKSARAFYLGILQQWNYHHICIDDPWLMYNSIGKMQQWRGGTFSDLAACIYHCNKTVKA